MPFIGYPDAKLLKQPTDATTQNTIKRVLWGDYAEVLDDQTSTTHTKVRCRNADGWITKDLLQTERLLEVNFIDVGQGDGCFIVTPDDKFILIDAGKDDSMYRFLKWRFNLSHNNFIIPFDYVILTHSDQDHYGGLRYILDSGRFTIKTIYHNGLVERTGFNLIGPVITVGQQKYITDLCDTFEKVKQLLDVAENRGRKLYSNLLHDAYTTTPLGVEAIQMLEKGSIIDGYDAASVLHMNVLGPVSHQDTATGGRKCLPYFDEPSPFGPAGWDETKNGHSVIIRLQYNHVSLLLGGDLNDKSQRYLTQHYTGSDPLGELTEAERRAMLEQGQAVFRSDVAKSCHHGSDRFLDDFLAFLNPLATVISSGDDETYTHPRPDTLGAIGKAGRGRRPLIFSTELARSTEDKKEIKDEQLDELSALFTELKTVTDPARKKVIQARIVAIRDLLERNVAVYGTINVRTDGQRVVLAQKKEKKGGGHVLWRLEPDEQGDLQYVANL